MKKKEEKKNRNPVRFLVAQSPGRAACVDLGSDPRTEQPTVAGDMVNKSVSGDLLPKWHAGDNIHALPAFTLHRDIPLYRPSARAAATTFHTVFNLPVQQMDTWIIFLLAVCPVMLFKL